MCHVIYSRVVPWHTFFREASEDLERQAAIQEWESLDLEDWGSRLCWIKCAALISGD
jgi:hypothetical protein